ncbi:multidrug and toxin extrusion protein 1-like [Thalassophryne amazonica]|uniref:multidrug and toxin extrusion protein 1-like n=1 Tax=Thalassophryne amazonica TaxID=390379 RepID=UPI001470B344|nr:multidrug and toxin extrusion protein 1-like [Thalassophryne amazonica]
MEEESGAGEAACDSRGSSDGCSKYLKTIQNFIPVKYWNEFMELVKLAGPVVLSQLTIFSISVISTVFCGHLGKTELAGVSLAISIFNITGVSIGTGLAQTFDTFISQTYGSGNLSVVGVILQRGILILLLACFPCGLLSLNTEPILLAVKQIPEVARVAQLYVEIIMPALPAAFMFHLQVRYLQNQGIVWPQVITGAAANVVNIIINAVLLYYLQLGVVGSAAANTIAQYSLLGLLYTYIWWKQLLKSTWGGWSLDCLQEWGFFIKLAVPSMLMLCLEWWIFELGGFLSGLISEAEVGAQSISCQISFIIYMIPFGFSAAASVRVGSALGAGNIEQARLSSKVPIICTLIIACVIGVILIITRNVIGYIFTSAEDIVQRVGEVIFIYGFMHFTDTAAGVAGGVVRGVGKQLIGAACSLVGYYVIGFPVGVSLMFAAHMGIVGLWTGLTISVTLQAIFYIVFFCKLNWEKAAEEAVLRAGIKTSQRKQVDQMENPDSNPGPDLVMNPHVRVEENSTQHELQGPVQNESMTMTVGEVLPLKQLLLRRSLTVLIMILILVAGIIIKNVLMKLFK